MANARNALMNLQCLWKNGAGEAIRTLDPNLGKVETDRYQPISRGVNSYQIVW
jgi:hypothetical protein